MPMTLIEEAANGLGAVLLPLVMGLLFEELTLGGLVRLLIAPRPKTTKNSERNHPERNGERKCSH
jgi:hypothetical protein